MENRRCVLFLSVLALVVLLCGLCPTAYAGAVETPAACGKSVADTVCQDDSVLRTLCDEILEDYLMCMTAVDQIQNPSAREKLLTGAETLWNIYLDLLTERIPALQQMPEAEAAAPQEAPVPTEKPQQTEENRKSAEGKLPKEAPFDEDTSWFDQHGFTAFQREWIESAIVPFLSGSQIGEYGDVQDQPAVGLPNPWTQTDSLEEAIRVSGVNFIPPAAEALPQNMALLYYRAMKGTVEADYSDGRDELMLRASLKQNGLALSGDYNLYSQEWQQEIGGLQIDCLGDGETVNVAAFKAGDVAYAIDMACGREGAGLTKDELRSLLTGMELVSEPEQQKGAPSAKNSPDRRGSERKQYHSYAAPAWISDDAQAADFPHSCCNYTGEDRPCSNSCSFRERGCGNTDFRDAMPQGDWSMSDNRMLIDSIADELRGTIGMDCVNPYRQGCILIIGTAPGTAEAEDTDCGTWARHASPRTGLTEQPPLGGIAYLSLVCR